MTRAAVYGWLAKYREADWRPQRPPSAGSAAHWPPHRSKAVKAFADANERQLRLWFLPGYLPELNPDEWVWKHVKHDASAALA